MSEVGTSTHRSAAEPTTTSTAYSWMALSFSHHLPFSSHLQWEYATIVLLEYSRNRSGVPSSCRDLRTHHGETFR